MSLRRETVSPQLFALLQRMMAEEALSAFALGGGTSLALRLGHRRSIDIDLFSTEPFDAGELAETLPATLPMEEVSTARNSVSGLIGGIKVDLLAHRYPLVRETEDLEGVRLLSLEDVAAMKLNAIANRGSKKDFWDYAELLARFDREEMLAFFATKYSRNSLWNLERALLWFDDAESEPDPLDLSDRSWEEVKRLIRRSNRME